MTRRLLARPIMTGDNTDPPAINQRFQVNENMVLKVVRALVIVYNDPTFTSLAMNLYASRSNLPVKKIAASQNSWTKAQITTLDYAYKELYFEFDDVPLRTGQSFHLGIVASGYTGTQNAHFAWAIAWPDPPYRTNVTVNQAKSSAMPLAMTLIGSPLP